MLCYVILDINNATLQVSVDDANSDFSMAPSSAGTVGMISDFEDLTNPLDLTINACLQQGAPSDDNLIERLQQGAPSNDNLFEKLKLEFKNGFSALLKANSTTNAATMAKLTVST
jgi:hypothetical protein